MTDLTIPAESRHLLSRKRKRELSQQARTRLEVGPALHAVMEVSVITAPMILTLAGSALTVRRKRVFLALTDRQLICVRPVTLSRMARVRFRMPRELARVKGGPRGRRTSSVIYFGPGARARGLRITVSGAWRHDLDGLVCRRPASLSMVTCPAPGRPASPFSSPESRPLATIST